MKRFRSILATFLAGAMTISMAAPTMAAEGQLIQTFDFEKPALLDITGNSNQTSSKEETIYVSSIDPSVRTNDLNEHWRFYLGEANGAELSTYDDSSWRDVNLPHDYSIEQDFSAAGEAESGYLPGGTGWYRKNITITEGMKDKVLTIDFGGAYMNATVWLNGVKLGTHPYGYTSFAFELPKDAINYGGDNVIAVQTKNQLPSSRYYSGSGLYRKVYLTVTNPVHVARYGTTVTTPNLKDQSSGDVTVNATTKLENKTAEAAEVSVRYTIYPMNSTTSVGSATSNAVSVPANSAAEVSASMTVNNPTLWGIGEGNLYNVRSEVLVNGAVVDTYDTDFGFRYFSFNANTGFSLNGEAVKLLGMCMHHDQGALGAEAWYRAIERQVEILQEMGVNAIRVTHNPAADELIEICNKKGVLVIDEAFDTWLYPKNGNTNDFSVWFNRTIEADNTIIGGEPGTMTWAEFDLKTMVERGKNDPSIIMWSLGNEVFEGLYNGGNTSSYPRVAQNLIDWTKEVDTTRPVTIGDNQLKDSNVSGGTALQTLQTIADAGGVVGFNYLNNSNETKDTRYKWYHAQHPDWLIVGAETASATNSRGVYDKKNNNSDGNKGDRKLTSYDKSAVGWGGVASDAWMSTITNDFCAGEFVWTGFDYIGEPTPWNGTSSGSVGTWNIAPKNSYFGVIETTGFPKDSFYFYQSQWNDKVRTLHILPSWNEEEIVTTGADKQVEVVVYSDAAKVKLEYIAPDGSSTDLGTKEFTKKTTPAGFTYQVHEDTVGTPMKHQDFYLTWQVPYKAGTLKATAYDKDDNVISNTEGRSSVKTTGAAAKLVASADRATIKADGNDLSYITIDVQDADGNFVNGANPTVNLSITGDGVILGTDNGLQPDHTSYLSTTRTAFNGKLLAIVQSTKQGGSFTLTASANGLTAGSATVTTEAVGGPSQKTLQSYRLARNLYVKMGTTPTLPATVQGFYTDGTSASLKVIWDAIPDGAMNQLGLVSVAGKIEGTDIIVSININVMDTVTALLNYSTGISLGNSIVLPPTRPAVMADGTILNAEFPVTWEAVPENAGTVPGIVTVKGVANVFDKAIEVTATIRVAEETVDLVGNVADVAMNIKAPATTSGSTSDINNGNTSDTGWTGNGDVIFEYATAQSLGQVKLYFPGTAPADNEATLYWAPNATDYEQILVKGIDTPNGNGVIRTYNFNLVPAVFFKLNFAKTVTLTEAELYAGTSSFALNTSDELTAMTVNQQEVTRVALASREISTPGYFLRDLTVESGHNASYTLLPIVDNVALILTESEDHQTRGQYKIKLRGQVIAGNDPADDSRDYDYTKTTATAMSEQKPASGKEGPISFANDGDTATYWHTKWSEDLSGKPEDRWIQLELEEATLLDGLRYLPRPDLSNGFITSYEVKTSMDGTTWDTVATGTWARNSGWKAAVFTEPVTAKYVRLYAVSTYDTTNKPGQFVSAAEVHVQIPVEVGPDISTAKITIDGSYEYTGNPVEPQPVVIFNDKTLEYGMDYVVSYENNIEVGTATLTIQGIYNYSGSASTTFTIGEVPLSAESYLDVKVTTMKDVAPVLPEKVTAKMNIGPDKEFAVTWNPIDAASYAKIGNFIVEGTVEGQTAKPAATITVIEATSAENVGLVTMQNFKPTLPTTVRVYFSDGSEKEYPVTWDAIQDSDFAAANTTVTVNGAVELGNGQTLPVTATVRVTAEGTPGTDNWALNTSGNAFPKAFSSHCTTDYASFINDGNESFVIEGKQIWSDWVRTGSHDSAWVAIALGSGAMMQEKFVNKVSVGLFDEKGDDGGTGGVRVPTAYKVQYYVGPAFDYGADVNNVSNWTDSPLNDAANWKDVTPTGSGYPPVPAPTEYAKFLDVNFETVKASLIRVLLTPKASCFVGVNEMRIYGIEAEQPKSDFEVTSIKVAGVEKLAEFDDTKTLSIQLASGEAVPEVTATATNNATITIAKAPSANGVTTIVITPEDGNRNNSVTYTVKFITAANAITVDTGLTGGSLTVDPTEAKVGDVVKVIFANDPGYELKPDSLKVYRTGNPSETVSVVGSYFTMPDYPVTVTAESQAVTYKIEYALNGGSVATENPTSYTVETASITLVNPTKENDVFTGWTGSGVIQATTTLTIPTGSTGDRSYVAHWAGDEDPNKEAISGSIAIDGETALGSTLTFNRKNVEPFYATGSIMWTRNGMDSRSRENTFMIVKNAESDPYTVGDDTYTIVKEDLGKTITATFTANGSFRGFLTADKKIPAIVPEAPVLKDAIPGDKSILVSWEAPFNGGSQIISYKVVVAGAAGSPFTVAGNETSYPIEGLTNGQEYTISVYAENVMGAGPASATKKATPTGSQLASYTVIFESNGGTQITPLVVLEGTTLNLPTPTRVGYKFLGWFTEQTGGTQFTNTTPVTSDITLYAHWKADKNDDDNSGSVNIGGGGGGGSKEEPKTDTPTVGETETVKPDQDGNASVGKDMIEDAISKAQKEAEKNGASKNGIFVKVPVETTAGQAALVITIDATALSRMTQTDVKFFELVTDNMISMGFEEASLQQMASISKGNDVIVRGEKVNNLPQQVQSIFGTRPVFDITMVYLQDNQEVPIKNLNGKKFTISLPYTLQAGEKEDELCAVYVDENNEISIVEGSKYDKDKKAVVMETNHLSVYGIATKAEAEAPEDQTPATPVIPVFTDITTHWAKSDIEFVAARGILSGTAENTFSPNISMTRGMFVTALGRLANANTAAYTESSFTDVKDDAYYMGYIEWANEQGIVSGVGNGLFAPDQAVTRQEMAVIMANYAKAMRYAMPQTETAMTFTDKDIIAAWAAEAVSAMQLAGIISGRDDSSFDPQGTATRAEVASVLHRYVTNVVDSQKQETTVSAERTFYHEIGQKGHL